MNKTYVAIKYSGTYEDKETEIVYAGSDYIMANKVGTESAYTKEGLLNGNVEAVCIEYWEDGERKTIDRIIG